MPFEPAHQLPGAPTALAWHFAFLGHDLLLPEAPDAAGAPGALTPQPALPAADAAAAAPRHYLGRLDGHDAWALSLAEPPAGWRAVSLRGAMTHLPAPLAALAGRAAQVLEWDRTHRHCGVCGTPTQVQAGERARRCPACGHTAYPRISPAMMALVWRPGELLLARAPQFTPGLYSALAGFVEPGETLEDCVAREVMEEVGVRVRELRYWGSQSWPFPHSLMVAFTAEWVDGEIVPQPGEIEHAAWFPLDALPPLPGPVSIAGRLIQDVAQRLRAAG